MAPSSLMPRRSILSRFTGPLANRNRNISDFYIEPENPWKSYGPGEIVKGHVILSLAKGFDITHLAVCLFGYARVFKTQVVPGDGTPAIGFLGSGRGNRGVEYHGAGLVSLFQDECVLCGSGFLKKQIFKFGFELEFPPRGLPSSIDFERGTVSYLITATLTRPNSITPTSTCFRKVLFQDDIDIANIAMPKPRTISLEPISKRNRTKIKVKTGSNEKAQEWFSLLDYNTGTNNSPLDRRPPGSPVPSEISGESAVSNNAQSFQFANRAPSIAGASLKTSGCRSDTTSSSTQTITATTNLLKQGALPGDTVPIKIFVNHTKPDVRGLVIVTLYRQGRIDMHPDIPLGSTKSGKSGKHADYEDIYPRSKSGLGGLYFSQGSPNSVHRKDLSQSSSMMIVNPRTLTAEVKTSIRVPDDAFPTMINVPGGMIAFRYIVEVVIDLCGKLGEPRFLPRLTSQTNTPEFLSGTDNGTQLNAHWANSILDTAQLRRTKSVIDCSFQLTVGSRDSARVTGKWHEGIPHMLEAQNPVSDQQLEQYNISQEEDYHEGEEFYYEQNDWDGQFTEFEPNESYQPPPPHLLPPPQLEEAVDEKTRLRQQEALLLPSRPPEEGESSTTADERSPTAPYVPAANELWEYGGTLGDGDGPAAARVPSSGFSTRSTETITPDFAAGGSSRIPLAFEISSADEPSFEDDKQELERQRLLAQASAPLGGNNDHSIVASSSSSRVEPVASAPSFTPTAPTLTEEDEYNTQTLTRDQQQRVGFGEGEHLPRYHR